MAENSNTPKITASKEPSKFTPMVDIAGGGNSLKVCCITICQYVICLQGLSGGGSVGGTYAVTPNTSLYGAVSGYKVPGQSVKVRSSFK